MATSIDCTPVPSVTVPRIVIGSGFGGLGFLWPFLALRPFGFSRRLLLSLGVVILTTGGAPSLTVTDADTGSENAPPESLTAIFTVKVPVLAYACETLGWSVATGVVPSPKSQ